MMNAVSNWWFQQISEISSSRALRIYGAILAAIHLLTAYFWRTMAPDVLTDKTYSICWAFFPSCEAIRFNNENLIWGAIVLYGLFAVVTGLLFLVSKIRSAWWLLAALTIFKFLVFALDYRFMGNYHYMSFLVTLAYLTVPEKKKFIPILICLFYFSAGLLKFNREWLEGHALLAPLKAPDFLVKPLLFYVLPLEVVFTWFLLFKPGRLYWFTFANYIFFHAYSWHVVGYFYPCLMYLLLSWFVLVPWFEKEPLSIAREFLRRRLPKVHFALIAIFLMAQIPQQVVSKDSALTTEGRLFALNMLDAKSYCNSFTFVRYRDRIEEVSQERTDVGVRIRCDPMVFHTEARRLCAMNAGDPNFEDIDVYLLSRRESDMADRRVLEIENFCRKMPKPSLFSLNSWILDEDPVAFSAENSEGNALPWTQSIPKARGETRASDKSASFQFRGDPSHLGHMRNPEASRLLKGNFKELWRRPNGNVGVHSAPKSSPAVDDSGIYVGGDSGWFFAYGHSGDLKWKFFISNSGRGIHGTAALDDEAVYLGGYNGRVYKLDKKTGRVLWAIDLGEALGASPVLRGDSVYVTVEMLPPDGYVARLDRATGKLIWRSKLFTEQSHSTPTVDEAHGQVVAGDNRFFVRAFDIENGHLKWEQRTGAEVKSTIAAFEGALYFTSWDQTLYSLDASNGSLRWSYQLSLRSQSSPAIWPSRGLIVVADSGGMIHFVDMKSGHVRKTIKKGSTALLSSPTVVEDEKGRGAIVMTCSSSALCVFDDSGAMLAELPTKSMVSSTPTIWRDRIYFSEETPGDLVSVQF